MSDIPDKAVRAAAKAIWPQYAEMPSEFDSLGRAALEAALPYLKPDPWAAQMQTLAEENARLRDGIRALPHAYDCLASDGGDVTDCDCPRRLAIDLLGDNDA
jgi:hypothetical protein